MSDVLKILVPFVFLGGAVFLMDYFDPPTVTLPSGRKVTVPKYVKVNGVKKIDEYKRELIEKIAKGEMAQEWARSLLSSDASQEDIDFLARWYASRIVEHIL